MKTILYILIIATLIGCSKSNPIVNEPPTFRYYSMHHRPTDSVYEAVHWEDSLSLYYLYDTTKLYKVLHNNSKYVMPTDTPFYGKIRVMYYYIDTRVFPYKRDTAIYTNTGYECIPEFKPNEKRETKYRLTRIK